MEVKQGNQRMPSKVTKAPYSILGMPTLTPQVTDGFRGVIQAHPRRPVAFLRPWTPRVSENTQDLVQSSRVQSTVKDGSSPALSLTLTMIGWQQRAQSST